MTTTNPMALKAQAIAARSGKRLATFIKNEIKKAGDAGDIRIDMRQIREALSRGAHLARPDVPRKAFLKDGTAVDVPADLKDDFNPLYKDANGINVAATCLPDDFKDKPVTSPSPAQPLLAMREVWPVLAMVPFMALAGIHWSFSVAVLLAYAFFARPDDRSGFFGNLLYIVFGTSWKTAVFVAPVFLYLVFAAPGWLASAALPMWMFLKAHFWLVNRNGAADPKGRAKALFGQVQHLTRTGYATLTAHEDKMHLEARQFQVDRAVADTTLLMNIRSKATGFFTTRGSLNSPDEGKEMVFTSADLGPGMLVVGTSGTGKTRNVGIPLIKEIKRISTEAKVTEERYGLLVLDAKGELPLKASLFYEESDYTLLSPEDVWNPERKCWIKATPFAPIEGMNAEKVINLLADVHAREGDIWDLATLSKHLYTAVAMECAIGMGLRQVPVMKDGVFTNRLVYVGWSPGHIEDMTANDADRQALLFAIAGMDKRAKSEGKPSPLNHPLMNKAFKYFQENYAKMAENTKSSVNFNVSAWHMKSANRELLKSWWYCEKGARVEDIFKGKAIGILCPKDKYGLGALVVSAMVRQRVYTFLRGRNAGWEEGGTRAALVWDEVAIDIGKAEMEYDISAIQRSLGLTMVWMTQTITTLRDRLGKDRADALLDNLTKNIVCFATDAPSYQYLQEKLQSFRGFVPSSMSKEAPVAIDFYGTQRAIDLAGTEGITIYDQERLEAKQTKAPKSMFTHGVLPNLAAMGGIKDADKLYKTVRDEDAFIRFIDAGLLSMEERPIFSPAEMARLLRFPNHAFMLVQRGQAPRFDLVETTAWDAPSANPANDPKAKAAA